MEKQYMILTAIGPDRPGIVREISALIHRAGGNLEDSRMAVLAQEFALIALFAGTPEAVLRVQRESRELERSLALHIAFKPTAASQLPRQELLCSLEVKGEDRPGIVHSVSEIAAELGVNVVSLESRVAHAAFSGTPLFLLHAELQVPDTATLARLRSRVEEACEQQQLACSLEPAPRRG
jgi:glycine cleavage system transcriptional repressor